MEYLESPSDNQSFQIVIRNYQYKNEEMTLEDLGYSLALEDYRKNQNLDAFEVGRVISEHKDRYIIKTTNKEYGGEIIGNLRFSAHDRSDFPAVGDWVALSVYGEDKALIHAIFPRSTIIERQAVGKQGERQIIATNIDYAFIVQAVDRDFNVNRIERYLTICHSAQVKPIILLNKIDLIVADELIKLVDTVKARVKHIPIIAISNETMKGIEVLKEQIKKGKTYCLLGSSGVGKSTLTNQLAGKQLMETKAISSSTSKGRHVSSHRELIVLENGGILIDNPGMREVGITDATEGLSTTFDYITELSKNCKFKDCNHTTEVGCAVLTAVESGEIDQSSYENYIKMEREKEHFTATVVDKRKKDKNFGKMIKQYKKAKRK